MSSLIRITNRMVTLAIDCVPNIEQREYEQEEMGTVLRAVVALRAVDWATLNISAQRSALAMTHASPYGVMAFLVLFLHKCPLDDVVAGFTLLGRALEAQVVEHAGE